MVVVNGEVVAQGSQFSLDDVEVVTATVDLEEVRAARYAPSRGLQAIGSEKYRRIETPFHLGPDVENADLDLSPSLPVTLRYHKPEEEIALGPACFLWYESFGITSLESTIDTVVLSQPNADSETGTT